MVIYRVVHFASCDLSPETLAIRIMSAPGWLSAAAGQLAAERFIHQQSILICFLVN